MCTDEATDYSCCSSEYTEPNSVQRSNDQHTQRSVPLSFPDLPADLDQHLDQHMGTIDEILKNCPSTCRDNSDYCQIRTHLDALLQNISTTKSCLVLMNWVSQRYVSVSPCTMNASHTSVIHATCDNTKRIFSNKYY